MHFEVLHDSSVGIATRLRAGNFSHHTVRLARGLTQPPIHRIPGVLSLGVKRQVREADHSPSSSAKVKNAWIYTFIPPIRHHGVVLSYAQGQIYIYLYINSENGVS
jgi:hypothetical protein